MLIRLEERRFQSAQETVIVLVNELVGTLMYIGVFRYLGSNKGAVQNLP